MLSFLLLGSGCDPDRSSPRPHPIERVRTAPRPHRSPRADVSDEERLGLPPSSVPLAPRVASDALAWSTPLGWREKADPSGHRLASFGGTHPEVDCSVTTMPAMGGVAANVNRWRAQLGLGEAAPATIEALPRRRVLGGDGTFVELENGGRKLLGLIHAYQALAGPSLLFVKLVGPAAAVDADRERFLSLCDSLHTRGKASTAAPAGAQSASGLVWEPAPGWTQAPPAPMRLATFRAGPERSVECWIVALPGSAGGLDANVGRWLGQMGRPPLDGGVDSLPRIAALGRPSPFLDVTGDYTDTNGAVRPGWRMLAVACALPARSVFVKMIGPAADVAAQRDAFVAFCASLREEGAR